MVAASNDPLGDDGLRKGSERGSLSAVGGVQGSDLGRVDRFSPFSVESGRSDVEDKIYPLSDN